MGKLEGAAQEGYQASVQAEDRHKKLVLALDQHLQFLSMSASLNQQCPVKITFHCIINSLDGGSEWQIIPVAVNCVNISIKLPPDDYR